MELGDFGQPSSLFTGTMFSSPNLPMRQASTNGTRGKAASSAFRCRLGLQMSASRSVYRKAGRPDLPACMKAGKEASQVGKERGECVGRRPRPLSKGRLPSLNDMHIAGRRGVAASRTAKANSPNGWGGGFSHRCPRLA